MFKGARAGRGGTELCSLRIILTSNVLPARGSHFSSNAITILKLCVYAQQHPPLSEFQPKSRAFPFVRHGAAGAPGSAARSPTTISPKPRCLSVGGPWLPLSRVREAGTGPELTPTRVGAGGGAAALGAGAGRGPGAQPGKGRDRGTLAAAAGPGASCQAAPPRPGKGRRGAGRGGSVVARERAKAAADTHSARIPGSLLPPPPYCSRPGRARGLKPRDNLPERSRGGACMGA